MADLNNEPCEFRTLPDPILQNAIRIYLQIACRCTHSAFPILVDALLLPSFGENSRNANPLPVNLCVVWGCTASSDIPGVCHSVAAGTVSHLAADREAIVGPNELAELVQSPLETIIDGPLDRCVNRNIGPEKSFSKNHFRMTLKKSAMCILCVLGVVYIL